MTNQIENPDSLPLPDSLYGGGLVLSCGDKKPTIGNDVFIAHHASVVGEVTLGDNVSIWFGAILRGDIAPVKVGDGSNVQDNSVCHVGDDDPCIIGKNVVVGHNCILHGCTVEDGCMIGMGAIILNKAVIGRGSVVGAGALVTQETIIPPYSLVLGSPAKVRRELTDDERAHHAVFAPKYTRVAQQYKK